MGFWRRRAEDRAVEQWRRELEVRLQHPIDLEPRRHHVSGGLPPLTPVPLGAPPPTRRTRGPLLPAIAVIVAILAFVMLTNPGSTSYWAKEMVRRATGGTSTSYAFISVDTSTGRPVGWDTCSTIHYRVNPQNAPDGWQELVTSAFEEVSEAGGFAFVYDGTTRDRDFLRRHPNAPVLIGWGMPDEYPELDGDVAGFGGASSVVVGGRPQYVTGEVLLDSGDYDRMAARDRTDSMRLILVHEILHVVGLDHVKDRHQLMYPSYQGQDGLGAGDIEGLRKLHSLPCA